MPRAEPLCPECLAERWTHFYTPRPFPGGKPAEAVTQKRIRLPAKYRPTSREEFMSPRMREYFRRKLEIVAAGHPERDGRDAREAEARHRPRGRPRRPRGRRVRALGPASHAGPRPQAHLQDRGGAPADRGRLLRLLRGNCGAHQPPPAGGASRSPPSASRRRSATSATSAPTGTADPALPKPASVGQGRVPERVRQRRGRDRPRLRPAAYAARPRRRRPSRGIAGRPAAVSE